MFDLPSRCSDKYLNSSLFLDSKIWDTLPEHVQRADDLTKFVKLIYHRYAEYHNLLDP